MPERILSSSAALAEALHEEMQRDNTIFIMGEDLVAHAGIFGQFKGLPEAFPGRIIDTPISEACIAGCGVGAAMTGMRPIIDFHFSDFVTCGMDELVNQAAKIRYMSGGQVRLPMVVWCPACVPPLSTPSPWRPGSCTPRDSRWWFPANPPTSRG